MAKMLYQNGKNQINTSCSVPFCSQSSAINNHPFCWNKICTSVGIASVEFDETELIPLCIKHYGLVFQFVNAIQIHEELCQVCGVKSKHDKLLNLYFVQILNLWSPS